MKLVRMVLFLHLVLGLSLPSPGASVSALKDFCEDFDKTLRQWQAPQTNRCVATSSRLSPPRYASAQKTIYQGKPATSLSEEDAQKLFTELQSYKDIPYGFAVAGCDERSYEMSRRMVLQGLTPLRGLVSVEDRKSSLLKVAHPSKANKVLEFHYHVAPVVLVRKNGEDVPYSLDPTFETKAVPTAEWKSRLLRLNPKAQAKLELFPANTYGLEGRPTDFTNETTNQDNLHALKQFSRYNEQPDGEDQYLNDRQLQEWKMNPTGD